MHKYGIAFACAFLVGCSPGAPEKKPEVPGIPPRNVDLGKSPGAGDPKVDLVNAKPDFSMDAQAWQDEWAKNGEAAKNKYKGKIVELAGVVGAADDDPYLAVGYIYLKLKSSALGLRCGSDDLAPWLKTGPGCKVKIKGVLPDFGSGELVHCVIAESSPNTSLSITAAQLAKDFAADKKTAEKKYQNKRMIVEGELVGKEPSKIDEGRFIYLTLKGDGAVNVRCYVANNSDARQKANDALKAGQKVRVCGEADLTGSYNGPSISSPGCRMVTLAQ